MVNAWLSHPQCAVMELGSAAQALPLLCKAPFVGYQTTSLHARTMRSVLVLMHIALATITSWTMPIVILTPHFRANQAHVINPNASILMLLFVQAIFLVTPLVHYQLLVQNAFGLALIRERVQPMLLGVVQDRFM